ncbi:hypothetical protein F7018_00950 [Tenacibaculum aiptasiae]|uniref:SRPBCC family protein n=1 Tax=Tenacibaculum aiptasiae TaxID=426481 RepID=A0A7J5AS69_9FLAO|nr:hypothetical protein [Tenacibaculum aiptasiae]KAB1160476.1 hypothetical protein F7018_00950 [Tenacibaculum aiptasiae]
MKKKNYKNMKFFSGYKQKYICNEITLNSSPEQIWKEITDVMVNKFPYPIFLSILGVPKPVSAKVIKEGVGGYRVAHFSNDAEFQQEILEWDLHKKYRFSFNASDNFKVGHVMNLSNGPFEIKTGGYQLTRKSNGVLLELSSNYKLKGFIGFILHLPFRFVTYKFQKHLLKAIKTNCK